MTFLFRVATPALLLVAAALGVRAAAREIALPFEGIERLAKIPIPESPIATLPDFEVATEPPPEPEVESPLVEHPTVTSTWEAWRAQAIAALPEELRSNSIYVTAIENLYIQGLSLDDISAEVINRPAVGGYGFAEVGFTDIDEQTAERDRWVALWSEWRAQEIAALPESLRNDANWLSVIDTTYNEMVGLKGGGVTRQFMYINNIRFEVEYYADSSPGTEVFDDAQVDP